MSTRKTAATEDQAPVAQAEQKSGAPLEIKDMTHANVYRSVLNQNKGAVLTDTLIIGITGLIKELCEDLDEKQAALKAGTAE